MTAMTLADHALDYVADGWLIFPVNPNTKAPLVDGGMKAATADPISIAEWWTRWPDALIGCRIPRDMVLLDIDPRHGGLQTWEALLDLHGPLTSRCHFSGRGDGGFHIWLTAPGTTKGRWSVRALNQWAQDRGHGHAITDSKHTAGIDLLHHGHRYTILPPSPHPETGDPYTWAHQGPPTQCPAWLAELITVPDTPTHTPAPPPVARRDDSIADWYTNTQTWDQLLTRHGWTSTREGQWRHPQATSALSATITHNCLFVYSPNTPFDETADGEPHGYTLFNAYATLEHRGDLSAAAKAAMQLPGAPQAAKTDIDAFVRNMSTPDDQTGGQLEAVANPLAEWRLDWPIFWATDHKAEDFLCAPILARGRGHAFFAKAKTGKSLFVLEMVAAIATGRPFLAHPEGPGQKVLYIDYEMTPDDITERLQTFGYGPHDNLENLNYIQMPNIPTLDTVQGGITVVEAALDWGVDLVVIDTMARSVQGEENAMETTRDYFRHTGSRLKREGITTLRVDHAGKDSERGQRGSSAKNDDVDVVWEMSAKAAEPGREHLTIKATHKRMGWIPAAVEIVRTDAVPMHSYDSSTQWIEGTKELADELDRLGVPANAGRRAVRDDYSIEFTDRAFSDAKRYRQQRSIEAFTSAQAARAPLGAPPPRTTSTHHSAPPS